MTSLAICVTPIHSEPNIVVLVHVGRCKKWVSTLGAKEMLLVVCTLSKSGIVKSDELLVDDGRFTMITSWSKSLCGK